MDRNPSRTSCPQYSDDTVRSNYYVIMEECVTVLIVDMIMGQPLDPIAMGVQCYNSNNY